MKKRIMHLYRKFWSVSFFCVNSKNVIKEYDVGEFPNLG